MVGPGLIQRIENPERSVLRDCLEEACDLSRRRLREWGFSGVSDGILRRMSYTYYHDGSSNPDIAFIVQDPGPLQKRHTEQFNRISRAGQNYGELVGAYREFAKSWLRRRNADFSEQFFSELDRSGLLDLDGSVDAYLERGHLFEDIYLTDVVKYRIDGPTTTQTSASIDAFLCDELREISPDIVFVFGGDAWEAVYRRFRLVRVTNEPVDASKTMDVHGAVFRLTGPFETTVIPLAHMSGQVWYRFPPEEYIERLSEALRGTDLG